MAAEVLASLANALGASFASGFARQYARTTETLAALRVTRDVGGNGKSLAWDVSMDGATAAAHADGADVDPSEYSNDAEVPATVPWGLYRSTFSISDTTLDAAASSAGAPDALRDIFGERMEGAFTALSQQINRDILSGTGTDGSGNPTIVGLFGGALASTGTYATINRSTYALWSGNQLGNGAVDRPLAINLLDQLEENIYIASRMNPLLGLTTPGVRRRYKNLFEQTRRTTTDGGAPVRYGTGTSVFDYNAAPIIRDADCPAGVFALLNTDFIELVQLPPRNMRDIFKATDAELVSSNGRDRTPLPLICRVSPLPKTGDAVKMMVSIKLQLRVRRPNASGYIEDIDET